MRRPALIFAAGCLLLANLTFGQTDNSQPMPGPNVLIPPTDGMNKPDTFKPGTDLPAEKPNHPPIDQIPWMPIPDPADGESNPEAPWTTAIHNALTGETLELPESKNLQNGFGQSLGDYIGAYNDVVPEPPSEGFGSMTPAGSLDTWPRSGNVKLVMRFVDTGGTDRWFVCSGSMQDSGVVLCAGHCVYARSPNGINIFDWAEEIYVYPAWDGVVAPQNAPPGAEDVIENFGWARGDFFLAGLDWINNGNFDRDCGLIRINRGSSRMVGMLTGWFGWAWGGDCDTTTTYHNFSYPAENCHDGTIMYYWSGTWDSCTGNQFQLDTGGNCLDTVWGGMSGSGAYYISDGSRFVHAVCSNSNRSTRGRYCKLWEQFVIDMEVFENDTRGTTFDLESLRCRATGSTTVTAGSEMDAQMQVYIANATNNDPASDNYTMRVYLSTNNNISESDTLLATWNYNWDFDPVSGVTFNIPAPTIPASTPPGSYWIGVVLDSGTDTIFANNDSDTWDAQPIEVTPINDDWADTIFVTFPFFETGSNVNATTEPGEPHVGPAEATVWWSFNAPSDGYVTIDTFGSDFDTMLHIYTGWPAALPDLTLVAQNDQAGGTNQSEVTFRVFAGEWYEVRVAGWFGSQGNIELNGMIEPVVTAEGIKLNDGVITGGGMADLSVSDNVYLEVDPSPTQNLLKQKVHLIVQSTSPTATPSQFEFLLESAMAGGPPGDVIQTIELLNYDTGALELLDTRAVTNFDELVQVTPAGDLSRFVQPITNEITAEITWKSESFSGDMFTWNLDIDEAVWIVSD